MKKALKPLVRVTIEANGDSWDGEVYDGAGFTSAIPDGEARDWAERKAWELAGNSTLAEIADPDNLRRVYLRSHPPIIR